MANEYAVNKADLTAVADAIRSKGGTSDALEFPGGFVDAVGAIQAGSGGEDYGLAFMTNTLTEIPESWKGLGSVLDYTFYKKTALTDIDLPNVIDVGYSAFENCTRVTSVNLPNVERIGQYAFRYCSGISEFIFPKLKELYAKPNNGYAFANTKATKFYAPLLESVVYDSFSGSAISDFYVPNVVALGNWAFANSKISIADFRKAIGGVGDNAFASAKSLSVVNLPFVTELKSKTCNGCTALEYAMYGSLTSMGSQEFQSCTLCKLVLHNRDAVATCSNVNSIANLAAIYVPASLLEEYKAATNWAVYADKIYAIEDSEEILAKLAEYGNEYEVTA